MCDRSHTCHEHTQAGGRGAGGPSKASEVAVPDQYICSITAEIMTDPVNTVRL